MAHNVTEAALPIALAVRADGGWDSLGGWTTLGLLIAVLVLLVRIETALVYVARAEAGLPVVEDTAAVAAPRAAGLRRARRALRFAPFFRAFVAIEFSFLALAAAVWDAVGGRSRGHAGAGDRAGAGRRADRRRAAGGHPRLRSGCDELRLRRAHPGPAARRAGAPRSSRCWPSGAWRSTSWWSATAGSPRGCRTACAALALARGRRASPAAATRACRPCAGELLFFLDDDAGLAQPDALARVAQRFAEQPDVGLLQLRVEPAGRGRRRRATGCRACASATATRSSDVTAVWEGAVAMPRAVFEQVGGWPARVPLRPRGHRPRLAGDGHGPARALRGRHRRPPPRLRHRAARLLGLLRRAQPRVARPPPPAAPARRASTSPASCARTLPLLVRSRRGLREAARGYRAGLRGPCGPRRPLRVNTLWRMTLRRPTSDPLAASLTARMTAPVTSEQQLPRGAPRRRVHGRAARLRAAQDRPAAARPVRARAVAPARVRARDGAHAAAVAALQHRLRAAVAGAQPAAARGRLLHPRRHPARRLQRRPASSPTWWPGSSPTTSSPTRCARRSSRSPAAGG